jgi:hypothetical protein
MLQRVVRLLAMAAAILAATAAPSAAGDPEVDGLYEVRGLTTVAANGEQRIAEGKVVIKQEEDGNYILTVDVQTQIETPEGWRLVDLTGSGEARRDGDVLMGKTETQWLMAPIPGIDPRFAFIPGRLGPRLTNTFRMVPAKKEGVWNVEIENRGREGDGYGRSTTTMVSIRVGDVPKGRRLPLPTPHDD